MNHSIRPIEKREVNKKKIIERKGKISKMWKRVNDVRIVGVRERFNEEKGMKMRRSKLEIIDRKEELMLADSEDMPETNPEEEMKAETWLCFGETAHAQMCVFLLIAPSSARLAKTHCFGQPNERLSGCWGSPVVFAWAHGLPFGRPWGPF